jgi:hypothetical protein
LAAIRAGVPKFGANFAAISRFHEGKAADSGAGALDDFGRPDGPLIMPPRERASPTRYWRFDGFFCGVDLFPIKQIGITA